MIWMETTAERRGDPRTLWPDVRSVIMLGLNYGPDHDPLAILEHRDRGAISVYAKGDDYHEIIKPRLKDVARWLIAQGRRRREGVRRHRRRDGEAAGGGRRARLAGQAHQFGFARFRLVAVSRRDLHHAGIAAGRRGGRSLRHLPGLPRRLPDRGVSRAVPARCAALHFVPDHRAQRTDPARIAAADRQPHLRLRRLPRGVSVEQVRASRDARPSSPRATSPARRCLRTLSQLDDAAFRTMFAKTAVKRTGRDRFIRNVLIAIGNSGDRFARCRRPSGCSPTPRRWCAAPRCGRSAGSIRRGSSRWRRRMPARPIPPSPRNGPPPTGAC